jgi:ParB/RepB/Spo0J family partition protein
MKVLMRKHPALSFSLVNTHEIDSEDRTYAITPEWHPLGSLLTSIQAVGLLVPLWLEQSQRSQLRIISGFRRFKAVQELGIEEVPCVVVPQRPPIETFVKVLWENIGSRELSELEKAAAVHKLKVRFGLSESELITQFLPVLGVAANRHHLEQYLDIAQLPESVQQAMATGELHTDVALALSEWRTGEQDFFIQLVSTYQMGRNKQRELFEFLGELRALNGCEVFSVWDRSGAKAIHEDQRLSPQDQLAGIKSALRSLRYPRLSEHEKRFQKLRKSLKLPSGVKLDVPRYFEGSQIEIKMGADSPAKLREMVRLSDRSLDRKELDQIFELL